MSLSFFGQKVHLTKTAGEWLFEGYEDPIIGVAKEIASVLDIGDIPFDKFGWFYSVSL
jgi:scavenger receptor class B, member 1